MMTFRERVGTCGGKLLAAISLAAVQTVAGAPVLTRTPGQTIDLTGTAFQNKTYLQATLEASDGIYDKTMADDTVAQTISSASDLTGDFTKYDPAVQTKVYGYLTGGQTGFETIVNALTTKSISPKDMPASIAPFVTDSQGQIVVGDIILIGSGAGTLVQLTPDDYFYNVSYQPPLHGSGRSYIVSGSRKLLDPSDSYSLNEIDRYIGSASAQEQTDFLTAFFKLLTACDTSGISSLSTGGQGVLTDLMGVYTAESMRHNMAKLAVKTNAWEIDIAEVTLLAPYMAASGMVMSNGTLVAGGLKTYASGGKTTYAPNGGYSIGVYEPDYIKLAKLITKFENQKKEHPDLVKAVTNLTSLTPKSMATAVKGDVFR